MSYHEGNVSDFDIIKAPFSKELDFGGASDGDKVVLLGGNDRGLEFSSFDSCVRHGNVFVVVLTSWTTVVLLGTTTSNSWSVARDARTVGIELVSGNWIVLSKFMRKCNLWILEFRKTRDSNRSRRVVDVSIAIADSRHSSQRRCQSHNSNHAATKQMNNTQRREREAWILYSTVSYERLSQSS